MPILKQTTILFCLGLAGCAGKMDYMPPSAAPKVANVIMVDESKDVIWKRLVANLSKQFYVINNIDKDSGLINVSYSGDPVAFIDCGRIKSYVKNAQGERTYDFPAAKAVQSYEVMDMENGTGLHFINRKMSLEGRANIVVQSEDQKRTNVSVNARYIVTKSVADRAFGTQTDTINFNSGGSETFPGGAGTTCHSTGKFESDILKAVRDGADSQ